MTDAIIKRITEQRLKISKQINNLESMLSMTTEKEARNSISAELSYLQSMQDSLMTEAEVNRRCEKLAAMSQNLRIVIRDNRAAYSRQTTRAVNALCGGGV